MSRGLIAYLVILGALVAVMVAGVVTIAPRHIDVVPAHPQLSFDVPVSDKAAEQAVFGRESEVEDGAR